MSLADVEADENYRDMPVALAGGRHMLPPEIEKIKEGRPSRYYRGLGKPELLEGFSVEEMERIIWLFHCYDNFGLPHGAGFVNETQDTLAVFMHMKALLEEYKHGKH